MKYTIKAAYPLRGEMFAVVYRPWPWPAKTRCPLAWTDEIWGATKFDTADEARAFVDETQKAPYLFPGTIVTIVGI